MSIKKSKKVYIVNYKYTTVADDNIFNVDCGTFDYGYNNIKDAIAVVKSATKDRKEALEDELYPDIGIDDYITTNGHYGCVTAGGDTYEYCVVEVLIDR